MDVHADYQKNELLFIQELITTDYNAMSNHLHQVQIHSGLYLHLTLVSDW